MAAELNTSLHAEHPDWTGRAGRDVTPLGPLRINLTLDWWGLRSVSEFYLNELDPYGGIKRAWGAAGGRGSTCGGLGASLTNNDLHSIVHFITLYDTLSCARGVGHRGWSRCKLVS